MSEPGENQTTTRGQHLGAITLLRASSVDQAKNEQADDLGANIAGSRADMDNLGAEMADFSADRRAALNVQLRGLDAKNVGFRAGVLIV
ncbi:MAG: hypothetical protein OXI72_09235 [Gemmatimonadota bacterium]|nr:hypothetical protein [Gemmatimonadota bacterium]